jgi:deazaflavin-dependent oxidoreductase (nitroreductase family)
MEAIMSDWNKQVIAEFRASGGQVGGNYKNMTLLLLHTTGAKSGQPRLNPVVYTEDNGRYVIIASKGGAPSNPDWYYNLKAYPEVEVEVGTEQFKARATITEEPERTRLYDQMAAQYPFFEEYRQGTERQIPVITLAALK